MASHTTVPKLYRSVVEDVINNVREAFLDDGVDEQVLQELKQLWESKLLQSKAVDGIQAEQDHLYKLYQQQQTKPQGAIQAQTVIQSPTPTVITPKQVVTKQVPRPFTVAPQPQLPIQYNQSQGAIELSAAAQQAAQALPLSNLALYQQQLAALQSGTITLQTGQGGAQIIVAPQTFQTVTQGGTTFTMASPQQVTASQMAAAQAQASASQTQAANAQQDVKSVIQIDGTNETSSDDDSENDDDDDDSEKEENEESNDIGEEEASLNSADDVSDQEPSELFDTDNIVVCQYDKINRNKNKWKFHLKDGIMNLNGKDYVFQKATGEAEW